MNICFFFQKNNNNEEKIDPQKSDKNDYNDDIDDIDDTKDTNNNLSKMILNVCITTAAAKGWVSPRLFVNIVGIKYSEIMNEWCTISTYFPQTMLNDEYKKLLKLNDKDIKSNVLGENISLYLGVKQCDENKNYSKVTYLLQSNSGGWIPQWAVEMGMVDQHMVAIFKKMSKWLLNNLWYCSGVSIQ